MSDMSGLEYRLTKVNEQGFVVGFPEHAYLCVQCGAVVVLPITHDAWHATLDAATAGDLR